jgi:hypothetical protein
MNTQISNLKAITSKRKQITKTKTPDIEFCKTIESIKKEENEAQQKIVYFQNALKNADDEMKLFEHDCVDIQID